MRVIRYHSLVCVPEAGEIITCGDVDDQLGWIIPLGATLQKREECSGCRKLSLPSLTPLNLHCIVLIQACVQTYTESHSYTHLYGSCIIHSIGVQSRNA